MGEHKVTGTELLGLLALVGCLIVVRFYVLIRIWQMVMVPMNLPALDIKSAFGVTLLIGAAIDTNKNGDMLKEKGAEAVAVQLVSKMIGLGFTLGLAYWIFG